MADGNPRRVRVAQQMRDVLAEMLERDVNDPRIQAVGLVSVSHVELNRDMSAARVYVSFYGGDDRAVTRAMAAFERVSGFLRGPLARRMRLRHAPALQFVHDTSIEFAHRITDIVRDDDARAVPDEPPNAGDADDAAPDPAGGSAGDAAPDPADDDEPARGDAPDA